MTYNRPELAVEPVKLTGSALAGSICKPDQTLEPPKAFDRTGGKDPSPPPGHDEWGPLTGRKQGSH
jgi:hypothetical protein